jgi:hypothetical protein
MKKLRAASFVVLMASLVLSQTSRASGLDSYTAFKLECQGGEGYIEELGYCGQDQGFVSHVCDPGSMVNSFQAACYTWCEYCSYNFGWDPDYTDPDYGKCACTPCEFPGCPLAP